jgi:hypothetical protein
LGLDSSLKVVEALAKRNFDEHHLREPFSKPNTWFCSRAGEMVSMSIVSCCQDRHRLNSVSYQIGRPCRSETNGFNPYRVAELASYYEANGESIPTKDSPLRKISYHYAMIFPCSFSTCLNPIEKTPNKIQYRHTHGNDNGRSHIPVVWGIVSHKHAIALI